MSSQNNAQSAFISFGTTLSNPQITIKVKTPSLPQTEDRNTDPAKDYPFAGQDKHSTGLVCEITFFTGQALEQLGKNNKRENQRHGNTDHAKNCQLALTGQI